MSNLASKASQLILISLLVKVLGFFREILMAYFYGTSVVVDVYVASMNIPSVIFALFGTAITTTFIPLYSAVKEEKDEKAALSFTNNVLNILVIIALLISILGIIYSEILVKVFAGGFSGETFELANNFTKIIMITIVFTVIQYIYNGYLQLQGFFNQNSLMLIPYNFCLIFTLMVSYYTDNFYVLAVGAVVASISQLVYLKFIIKKTDFKHSLVVNVKDKYIKTMFQLLVPVFFSTAINQLNNIVSKSMASGLEEGSISALNYSNKVNSIILEVVILSMTTILYPTLSNLFSSNKTNELTRFISKYINVVAFIVMPAALMISHLSDDIINILFGRGAFNADSVRFTGAALKITAIGLIGYAFRDVLNKIFYSMKDTKTPMVNGFISILLNIILNLILVKEFGYLGIAFSASFSAVVCTLLLLFQMVRKVPGLSIKKISDNIYKIILATLIMYIYYLALGNIIFISNPWIKCFVFGVSGSFVYLVTLAVLRDKTVREFFSIILTKLNR